MRRAQYSKNIVDRTVVPFWLAPRNHVLNFMFMDIGRSFPTELGGRKIQSACKQVEKSICRWFLTIERINCAAFNPRFLIVKVVKGSRSHVTYAFELHHVWTTFLQTALLL